MLFQNLKPRLRYSKNRISVTKMNSIVSLLIVFKRPNMEDSFLHWIINDIVICVYIEHYVPSCLRTLNVPYHILLSKHPS